MDNPETPRHASTSRQPTAIPSSQQPQTAKKRRTALSSKQKINKILEMLEEYDWNFPRLLEEFFKRFEEKKGEIVPVERTEKHQRVLNAMLDGTSKPHIGSILEKIYRCACSVKFRENDNTVPAGSSSNMFSSHLPPGEIKNARPGMITWAVRVISKEVNKEAEEMIRTETGLHLRASSKYKATSTESAEPVEVPDHKKRVSWNDVGSFSFNRLEKIANGHAPIMSFLT
ncbi:hypothetical protein GALMADRAFT_146569 [Galerina marginata CBS 339.88]|uniref:Uncharacterized protein n=1 Tax=Galerina marginata (strain CBS 339.88) TaxID=685588 RepID=A0A067SDK2_GALM3|nr:hypothetical protein GALMADRAFT_146569 [Galerina marginata CBS 339.88]